MDSTVNMNFVTLPLTISYTSGKPGKTGFYAEGGVKFSIPLKTSYNSAGNYETMGYYPDMPGSDKIINDEASELGWFYRKDNFIETGDVKLRGVNMAISGSAGVNIPFGYYSNISIGPEIVIGISDVMRHVNNYRDIFSNPYEHQPTKLRFLGIRVSFAYKL